MNESSHGGLADQHPTDQPRVLVIACGALARELLAIVSANGLNNVTVECLPASLHNRPREIPELVRQRIRRAREGATSHIARASRATTNDEVFVEHSVAVLGSPGGKYDKILVGYADCGTGGLLEAVCEEEDVPMLAGAHCYQFFATHKRFEELQNHELGSFYLTNFLARNWERLIWDGMGIAEHPELRDMYFGIYVRCVYLEQAYDPAARAGAEACAERLGLELHIEHTGYGELATTVVDITKGPR